MVDADHLRIVFRVNGGGFVMPVGDLLTIHGSDAEGLAESRSSGPLQLGSLVYRDTEVTVYDLAALFGLQKSSRGEDGSLLIFVGTDTPWAVRVDHVSGVVDLSCFEFQGLPDYLFAESDVLYHQVALHKGQLLVSVSARQIEEAWRRFA